MTEQTLEKLVAEVARLRALLREAAGTISGLADQQAIPDPSWQTTQVKITAALKEEQS